MSERALAVVRLLAGVAVFASAFVAFVIWDNHRLVVTEREVRHAQVPAEFDGFRIVQVTDLHGARFGRGQERLAGAIENARPDIVLLTGDYSAEIWPTSEDALEPLGELLATLPAGVPVYYVVGNWDEPIGYGGVSPTGSLVSKYIESRGVTPAHPAVRIERGDTSMWLHDWEAITYGTTETANAEIASQLEETEDAERVRRFAADWLEFERDFREDRDFGIAVTHRPLDFADYGAQLEAQRTAREEAESSGDVILNRFVDWDVNVAGHTHGGQYRIPGYGGLVTPSGDLFPDQRIVYGVSYDSDGRALCISSGLGAGGPIPWLRFRIFNPPEIAVYTLRRLES